MKLLSKEAQTGISRQMYNRGRDIDVALYNYLDEVMPKDYVLDALMFYMTDDGGFGRGLYIDNYNPNASVYQIYEAYRILDMADIGVDCSNELYDMLMNRSMNFLYNRSEIVENRFNPNVATNDSYAHSMEFSYTEDNRIMFGYAPTAALLGYTLLFCKPTKTYYKKALKMIDTMLIDFYQMEHLSKYEFISFNSFLNSIRKLGLYPEDQKKIEEKLTDLALREVSLDFKDSTKIHPLDCGMYLTDSRLKEMIDQELDYIIDSIAPHGLWEYEGDWKTNKYAEEDSAKIKWIGAVSVNKFYILKKFGRLE